MRRYLSPLFEYSRASKVTYTKPAEVNRAQYMTVVGPQQVAYITYTKRANESFATQRWYIKHLVHPKRASAMEGLYECVLCASCTTSCPSWWWNREVYVGPAVLLQAYRWVIEPLDDAREERLGWLRDSARIELCHNIFNCTVTCPKYLNPALAIKRLRRILNPNHNDDPNEIPEPSAYVEGHKEAH